MPYILLLWLAICKSPKQSIPSNELVHCLPKTIYVRYTTHCTWEIFHLLPYRVVVLVCSSPLPSIFFIYLLVLFSLSSLIKLILFYVCWWNTQSLVTTEKCIMDLMHKISVLTEKNTLLIANAFLSFFSQIPIRKKALYNHNLYQSVASGLNNWLRTSVKSLT